MDFEARVAFGHLIRAESVVQPADVIASAVFVSADIKESDLIMAKQLNSRCSFDRCLVSAGCGFTEIDGFTVTPTISQPRRCSNSFFRRSTCIPTISDRSHSILSRYDHKMVRYDHDHT